LSNTQKNNSYGQILKSSSIIGGAQGINYLVGMVRTKLVAVLLGPSGVGLVGLYMSATELVGTITGLGIGSSGVREVAEACGSGDDEQVARTVKTLRRVCWFTGLLGWLCCAALSYPLSVYTFGSGERAWAIAILGATILISAVSGGQNALIQGMRRISDLARMAVLGAVVATVVAVGLYAWLGQQGIVPVLIVTAAVNLGFSWWFARKIQVAPVTLTWVETFGNAKQLVHVGLAFMYGAVLFTVTGLIIRSLIVKKYGLDANGIYQASWGISGMFAGFIFNAMGTDFYPRLTAVAHDNEHVNRLVNEQTEIGILLALPGMLGTLIFAPWVMRLFYTSRFLAGADLLPWFLVGVFAQVIAFPIGFIQRAKGEARWIFLSMSNYYLWNLVLVFTLIPAHGIVAAAWAFFLTTYIQVVVVFVIARRLSNFAWTPAAVRQILSAAALIGAALLVLILTNGFVKLALGAFITGTACLVSLRGIYLRLDENHRIAKIVLKLPGVRYVISKPHV